MVDYTTKQNNGGWAAGVYLAAAFVVAMLLYGFFVQDSTPTVDADPAAQPAAIAD